MKNSPHCPCVLIFMQTRGRVITIKPLGNNLEENVPFQSEIKILALSYFQTDPKT